MSLHLWKGLLGVGIALPIMQSYPAMAQMQGSYLGVPVHGGTAAASVSAWADSGSTVEAILNSAMRQSDEAIGAAALRYQGRLDLPASDLSLRGSLYLENGAAAILPTVSYDMAVTQGVNVYAGAGYALVNGGSTALGDQSGLVLNAGAETQVLPGVIVFGDAKMGINTDSVHGNTPMRFQVGVGRSW